MRPQPIAQPALLGLQTTPRLVVPDREQVEGLARPRLRRPASPLDGIFKILAKFGSERGHGVIFLERKRVVGVLI